MTARRISLPTARFEGLRSAYFGVDEKPLPLVVLNRRSQNRVCFCLSRHPLPGSARLPLVAPTFLGLSRAKAGAPPLVSFS
jgi:hypothetical protein